jgi:hypothetical protein
MIEFKHTKLAKYILDKNVLLMEGKKIVEDMEKVQKRIDVLEKREKIITAKVKPSAEIEARGQSLVNEINAKTKELEKLGQEIEKQKLSAIPEDIEKEHKALLKEREEKEREIVKLGHKIEKIKSRMIPIIQKEVKPLLKTEFDDINTAEVDGDMVKITTFNHLEDFKKRFNRR